MSLQLIGGSGLTLFGVAVLGMTCLVVAVVACGMVALVVAAFWKVCRGPAPGVTPSPGLAGRERTAPLCTSGIEAVRRPCKSGDAGSSPASCSSVAGIRWGEQRSHREPT